MSPAPSTAATPAGLLSRALDPRTFAMALVCFLLWQGYSRQADDAKERRDLLVALRESVDKMSAATATTGEALRSLARETKDTGDVVRATWPALRAPRLARSPSAREEPTP